MFEAWVSVESADGARVGWCCHHRRPTVMGSIDNLGYMGGGRGANARLSAAIVYGVLLIS
jgi:hypothetical protein